MTSINDDQIEIIQEFVTESRDMIDQLEPTIIELGQSVHDVHCWEHLGCQETICPRHDKKLDFPCWLQWGHINEGNGRCVYTESKQDCLSCAVFLAINGDGTTMNAIFRLFHSMKGSAGFLELDHVTRVAHTAENLLDLIRNGGVRMQAEHVNLLCEACDFAKEALDFVEQNFCDDGVSEQAQEIAAKLDEAIRIAKELADPAKGQEAGQRGEDTQQAGAPGNEDSVAENDPFALQLTITAEMMDRFVQEGDELLQNVEQGLLKWEGNLENADIIAELFRNIHSFKGNCGFFGFADMEKLSHQMETVLDAVKSGTDLGTEPAEMMLGQIDILRDTVSDLADGGPGRIADLDPQIKALADLMARKKQESAETPAPSETPVRQPEMQPEPLTSPPQADADKENAPKAAPAPPKTKAPASAATGAASAKAAKGTPLKRQDIRVELEKLDNLINLIGEMVIAENMLLRNPDLEGLELENFTKAGQHMSKLVRELQEMAMLIRMVPVSGLFRRMIRLVHDLSVKSGKKAELKLIGEDTEMDKTVIETITDPLVHILRNSLDHGIEPPAERIAAGKPEKGTVKLSACHEEGEVWITIEDDGRGLDRDKILAKAVSKGVVEEGAEMSDKAVFNLIFAPGFSTADKITDISGRGVGMDVVKQNLDKIKGTVEVSSKLGAGTCIKLRIPLTMAIIDGMLVRVGQSKAIVPILAIKEAFRPQAGAITTTPDGEKLVRVRENFQPVIKLHEILGKQPDSYNFEDGILIVLESQETRVCLLVDEILGQQQTVIKGLSNYIGSVRGVSGCTILGNGEVCLIMDVNGLLEMSGETAMVNS